MYKLRLAALLLAGLPLAVAAEADRPVSFLQLIQINEQDVPQVDGTQPEFSAGALREAERRARLGYRIDQYNAGVMSFARGEHSAARYWFELAAFQKHAKAQYNLGVLYYSGIGTEVDYPEAARWLSKAAEQGWAGAQFLLGTMYGKGRGVERDFHREAKLYRKAAEQGHALAQYNLGVLYYNGEGVERDRRAALRWLERADAQEGIDATQTVGRLRDELTEPAKAQLAAQPQP